MKGVNLVVHLSSGVFNFFYFLPQFDELDFRVLAAVFRFDADIKFVGLAFHQSSVFLIS